MKQLSILILLTLFSIGCHHARVKMETGDNQAKGQVIMKDVRYWLGGMFPRKVVIDATKLCPAGVYEVDEFYRWQDAVITQITFGIYIPRTVKITCN